MNDTAPARLPTVAEHVRTVAEDVFASLSDIRATAVACHNAAAAQGRALRSGDLARLRPQLFERLRSEHDAVVGMGMIACPGTLADVAHRLEWWHWPRGPEPTFLEVDLDPESLDFYDYPAAEWFAVPRRTRRRHIVGPYVDFGGTDRYLLTFTVPVETERDFLGVVGADVPVERFETLLLPELASVRSEVVLVNQENRIILSNSARRWAGALLPPTDLDDAREPAASTVWQIPDLPWRLVTSPSSEPRHQPA